MIVEAFLTCALAVTPMAVPHGFTKGELQARQALLLSADFLAYLNRGNNGRFLLVGGDVDLLADFRSRGMHRTFQVVGDVKKALSPFQTVGSPGYLPMRPSSMAAVMWLVDEVPRIDIVALRDAISSVMSQGYFIYKHGMFPHWRIVLSTWGWHELPFIAGPYVIWQKYQTLESLKVEKIYWLRVPNLVRLIQKRLFLTSA